MSCIHKPGYLKYFNNEVSDSVFSLPPFCILTMHKVYAVSNITLISLIEDNDTIIYIF